MTEPLSSSNPDPTVSFYGIGELSASNYRVCDPSQQVPIEAKYKTSAGADNQSTTKQTSADKQSSTPSSISNILPPSPSSFLHSIFILLLCLPGCGSEAADSSSQSPKSY
jgi:hypothetical protein